jgi:hypothetical protein
VYHQHASHLIANSMNAMTLQANNPLDGLQMEIQSSALQLFVFEVDQLYKLAIQQHYNSFHFVNEPLLPFSTKALLYEEMSNRFPMHCAGLDSICTAEWNHCANNPLTIQKKQNVVLFHFFTLCWQQNKDYQQCLDSSCIQEL